MNGGAVWTVILGLGLVSALIRYSFLGLLQGREIPPRIKLALDFVPVTVMPAIAAPLVVIDPGSGGWAEPHRILAALAALAVGVLSQNMLAAVLTGTAAFVVLRILGL